MNYSQMVSNFSIFKPTWYIFLLGDETNSAEEKARIGTFLVGVFGVLGTLWSGPLLKYFGRKTMFLWGDTIQALCLFFSAIFVIADLIIGNIILTLIFFFAFNIGYGPWLWIYSSEILDSYGWSIVGLLNMLNTWIFGTFSNLGKWDFKKFK